MSLLPDVVGETPLVVFCGMANLCSPLRHDHHYGGPGNAFWRLLHSSGLTEDRLEPADDVRLPAYGLGVTDLVVERAPDVPRRTHADELAAKVERWSPEWLAMTSKTVAAELARCLGHRPPGLGITGWDLAGAPVFVLPGPSGANQRREYDGRPDRLSWWTDLAALVGRGPDAARV